MGQKTSPIGFRLGTRSGVEAGRRTWESLWCDQRNYASFLRQDLEVRKTLMSKLKHAGVSSVLIERLSKRPRITVRSAKPGVVIGRRGGDIEKLRLALCKKTGLDIDFNVVEVRKPELDARLVAQSIAQQLEKRVSFRRAMRKAIQFALRLDAKGIRVNCSGRLGGAEIARMEWSREGRVPLHKLRANIDYGLAVAKTTYGTCGVKVWIYLDDMLNKAAPSFAVNKKVGD